MERDVDLVFEVCTMRHIERNWKQFGGPNVCNVAEHVLRVAWIAQLLAMREGADVGRVLQMALVHDLGKTRTGDVHWMNRAYVRRDEGRAIRDSTKGTSMEESAGRLWSEFKAGKTLEAQIVKDADNLDVDVEFNELRHGWVFAGTEDDIREEVYTTKLHTASAKDMWRQIQSSDAESWYVKLYHTPESLGGIGAAE